MKKKALLFEVTEKVISGVIVNNLAQFKSSSGVPIGSVLVLSQALCLAQSMAERVNYPKDPQRFIFLVDMELLAIKGIESEFIPYCQQFSIALFIVASANINARDREVFLRLRNIGVKDLYIFPLTFSWPGFLSLIQDASISGAVIEYENMYEQIVSEVISLVSKKHVLLNVPADVNLLSAHFSYYTHIE